MAGSEELVAVAYARDPIEAQMLQGLLENAGIRSLMRPARRSADGPRQLGALLHRGFGGGPQQVMVHAARAEQANALLADTLVDDGEAPGAA